MGTSDNESKPEGARPSLIHAALSKEQIVQIEDIIKWLTLAFDSHPPFGLQSNIKEKEQQFMVRRESRYIPLIPFSFVVFK